MTALASPDDLLSKTRELARKERNHSVEILHHLSEIDRRRIYAKRGYSSLWDYATKELHYSENEAFCRISAMRALQASPELGEKVRDGKLNLSTLSQIQNFLKAERDYSYKFYPPGKLKALFENCENKNHKEVTRVLSKLSPLAWRVQKERPISDNRTEISFIADEDLMKKMNRVRDLSASRIKNPASYPELLDLMSEALLQEIDPMRRSEAKGRSKPTQKTTPAGAGAESVQSPVLTRYISPSLRARIWKEYGGRCAFVDSTTGQRCSSTFGLEIEHCNPHALGGRSDDAANLRLLCRHHNQWQAIQTYGIEKMEPFLNSRKPQD